jgi:hypothetical protein
MKSERRIVILEKDQVVLNQDLARHKLLKQR